MDAAALPTSPLADLIGGWEILLICAAILLLGGGKRLSELINGLRQRIDEFTQTTKPLNHEILKR